MQFQAALRRVQQLSWFHLFHKSIGDIINISKDIDVTLLTEPSLHNLHILSSALSGAEKQVQRPIFNYTVFRERRRDLLSEGPTGHSFNLLLIIRSHFYHFGLQFWFRHACRTAVYGDVSLSIRANHPAWLQFRGPSSPRTGMMYDNYVFESSYQRIDDHDCAEGI